MEFFIVFGIIVLVNVAIYVGVPIALAVGSRKRMRNAVEAGIREWDSRVDKTSATLKVDETRVDLQWSIHSTASFTVQIPVRAPFRLEVYTTQNMLDFLRSGKAVESTGLADCFRVRGEPDDAIRTFLDDGARYWIRRMSQLVPNSDPKINLAITPGRMVITVDIRVGFDGRLVNRLIHDALALAENASGPDARGVDVVEQVVRQGKCPVCWTTVPNMGVACQKCNTQHHRPCWSYFGGCSLYGCGGSATSADRAAIVQRP